MGSLVEPRKHSVCTPDQRSSTQRLLGRLTSRWLAVVEDDAVEKGRKGRELTVLHLALHRRVKDRKGERRGQAGRQA